MASLGTDKVTYYAGTTISAANLNAIQEHVEKYTVPEYSSANDGQVLMVVGGNVVWANIPAAETASF